VNKLLTTAETAALDMATAAPASLMIAAEEANGSWLQRCFNCPWLRRIAGLKTIPAVNADSQLLGAEERKSSRHQSALYGLAASNPHVIAISVFSSKFR
jgi:hypothetical protein